MYHNNSWQNVCKRNWTITEASVVCHELGYTKALSLNGLMESKSNVTYAYTRLRFKCTGTENKLSECIHEQDNKEFCEDGAVKVRCEGKEGGKKQQL